MGAREKESAGEEEMESVIERERYSGERERWREIGEK